MDLLSISCLLNVAPMFGVTIRFGQLEQVFTGFGQVGLLIGIILFVFTIMFLFFPAGKWITGKIFGGNG